MIAIFVPKDLQPVRRFATFIT